MTVGDIIETTDTIETIEPIETIERCSKDELFKLESRSSCLTSIFSHQNYVNN